MIPGTNSIPSKGPAPVVAPVYSVDNLVKIPYNRAQRPQGEECAICLSAFEDGITVRVLQCTHVFHVECIDQWLSKSYQCPTCKLQVIMPMATPIGATLEPTVNIPRAPANAQSTPYRSCRDCNRQFYLDPAMNPNTRDSFRCPNCRGFDHAQVFKDSCIIS